MRRQNFVFFFFALLMMGTFTGCSNQPKLETQTADNGTIEKPVEDSAKPADAENNNAAGKQDQQLMEQNGKYEMDHFTTKSGKSLDFYALVHASIRIVYDNNIEIMVDPVQKLGNRTINYSEMPQADFIVVTHEHADHFDKDAIKTLTKQNTQFITNQRCADMYGSGKVMNNGDKVTLSDLIEVEAVPAYNTTDGHTKFHPRGRDNGYIITIDGTRIYIAGDTEDISEMTDIKEIDIAFMPCNQPYTMTPDQLVHAARMVKPAVLFPYHYGETDVSQLPEQLKVDNIEVRIRHYE